MKVSDYLRQAAAKPLPKWSELYDALDFSWIKGVQHLVKKPAFKKELSQLIQRASRARKEEVEWSDLEALAKKYGSSWKSISLAAIYLYGQAIEKYGDYILVTDKMPNFLAKLL